MVSILFSGIGASFGLTSKGHEAIQRALSTLNWISDRRADASGKLSTANLEKFSHHRGVLHSGVESFLRTVGESL
ncbi:hypothetical protein SNK03_005234 [Fusarium graminearum]